MDYSWAFLFFFALGVFFLSKKIFELAILAFAFSVGCRLNFIIFVFVAIFLIKNLDEISFKRRIILSISTFIISGLFYLPVWFDNSFGLSWITAARPIEQGFLGLFARFTYKTWLAFGLIQFFLIVYGLLNILKNKLLIKKYRFLLILIISNLLLFLYIPAELSYLQPAIIFIYFIFIQQVNKKLVSILIIINFLNWGINFDILKINYKDNSICAPKHAVSASFNLNLKHGALYDFFKTREMIGCWVSPDSERGKRILKGQSTRIK